MPDMHMQHLHATILTTLYIAITARATTTAITARVATTDTTRRITIIQINELR